MYIALTVTCNRRKNFHEDKKTIQKAMQFLREKKATAPIYGMYEVQPNNKSHLLHLHALACSENGKIPFIPQAWQKAHGVNVKAEPTPQTKRANASWLKYIQKKQNVDPQWIYQQFHTNMFQ